MQESSPLKTLLSSRTTVIWGCMSVVIHASSLPVAPWCDHLRLTVARSPPWQNQFQKVKRVISPLPEEATEQTLAAVPLAKWQVRLLPALERPACQCPLPRHPYHR